MSSGSHHVQYIPLYLWGNMIYTQHITELTIHSRSASNALFCSLPTLHCPLQYDKTEGGKDWGILSMSTEEDEGEEINRTCFRLLIQFQPKRWSPVPNIRRR